jgi:hypothetical protein
MAVTDISQLSPDLQKSISTLQPGTVPTTQGENSLQTAPGTLPGGADTTGLAAPAAGSFGDTLQKSLMNPENGQPLTFNERFKQGVNAAAKATPPQEQAKPGAWARQILAGAQHALGGIEDSLSDAGAAAKESLPGEGALAAIGRIRAAQQARIQGQQKFQTEQQKAQADIAATNVQKVYHQALLHQLDDTTNEKDIKYGQEQVESMTSHLTSLGLKPGEIVAKNVTEAQLQKAVDDGTWNPTEETKYPTGSFEVPGKKDDQGNPLRQKTYTIVKVPPEQTLTKDMVDRVNKFVPGVKFDPDKPPTMPGATAVSLMEQAHMGETFQDQRDQQIAAADAVKIKELDQKDQIAAKEADGRLAKDPEYIKAQGQAHSNLSGMYDYLKSKDPQAAADLITSRGGPKNFDAIVEKQTADLRKNQEDAEKERHDRAVEIISATKEKDKADKENSYVGDDNAKTPEDYLKSLKPNEAAIVQSIASGHLDAGRMAYLLARNPNLVSAVIRYDPNFDNSKVAGYAKNLIDFTSGKVGESLKAGATAMNHLRELYDLNTEWSRMPGTSDHQKYENKLDTVASELAGFYGDTTIPAIEGIKKTLGATFNRGAAIQTQANSMADRYDNIKQQWIAGAPSDKYYGLMPDINQKAKDDLQYVRNGGKSPVGNGSGKAVSLAAAMALPINKGKTEAQVRADIQAHGHQVQ